MSARVKLRWPAVSAAAALLLFSAGLNAQTVEYIHTDALGTPIAVTNASRVVIERSEYEPYGKLLNRPLTDGPGFTGHVQDAATGMTYMQQRYYDPGIGRFLSVDPVAAEGTNGNNFNRYKYAANNVFKFVDPDGRADVNYFHKNDFLYDAAERFDIPGFTTVMGHATPHNFWDDSSAPGPHAGSSVSTKNLVSTIEKVRSPGDWVFLGGCLVGGSYAPFNVARELSTSVISTIGFTRKSENKSGDITYTVNSKPDGQGRPGYFQITAPDGETSGRIGSVTMRADGKVTFKAAEAVTGTRIKSTQTIDPKELKH